MNFLNGTKATKATKLINQDMYFLWLIQMGNNQTQMKKKYTTQRNFKTKQLCQIINTKSNMEDLYDKKTIVMQKFTHTTAKWKENNCT